MWWLWCSFLSYRSIQSYNSTLGNLFFWCVDSHHCFSREKKLNLSIAFINKSNILQPVVTLESINTCIFCYLMVSQLRSVDLHCYINVDITSGDLHCYISSQNTETELHIFVIRHRFPVKKSNLHELV